MPRKKKVGLKRELNPDLKYGDKVVAKLINHVMFCGKKGVAEKVVYGAFHILTEKHNKEDALETFKKALENIKPQMEVRSRRVGGANYQVPVEVRSDRKLTLGLKWMIDAARTRSGKSMEEKLAIEILEALENRGAAVKKREDVHKMAEANRAFAHYRW